MTKKSNKIFLEKLSFAEEQAMQAIWQLNGGFVKELLNHLDDSKLPYTTLASTVKNLEKKGYIKGVKYANAYRYESVVPEEQYKTLFMKNFVSDYFKNSYKELVSFFAKEEKITAEDLKDIVRMIEKEE
ncbi:BlaI/MecI/CopY family transcriptional regulator [Olivibacter sp. SDN3]|uniref:BlaI/MecI/CopY family transcriptional regulator n=1 Tax=Olivibacter sp. SDN3 TaxID=2764720 RepID=UPI00165128D0|nr:BlaI/MecI/CopY family transcriptional regulator [Olivibacter sp. SDN3]QNL51806.1 BlaI/MecI/CopY family transcriptional regulator [Olivibacter sp. SDN3]